MPKTGAAPAAGAAAGAAKGLVPNALVGCADPNAPLVPPNAPFVLLAADAPKVKGFDCGSGVALEEPNGDAPEVVTAPLFSNGLVVVLPKPKALLEELDPNGGAELSRWNALDEPKALLAPIVVFGAALKANGAVLPPLEMLLSVVVADANPNVGLDSVVCAAPNPLKPVLVPNPVVAGFTSEAVVEVAPKIDLGSPFEADWSTEGFEDAKLDPKAGLKLDDVSVLVAEFPPTVAPKGEGFVVLVLFPKLPKENPLGLEGALSTDWVLLVDPNVNPDLALVASGSPEPNTNAFVPEGWFSF